MWIILAMNSNVKDLQKESFREFFTIICLALAVKHY